MSIIEINKMSKIERLQTMEAIWDSLIHEEPVIESPEWHQDVLAERKAKIENGAAKFLSVEELKSKYKP